MAKVKITQYNITECETNYDYPVYLYFQDECFYDELIMLTETNQIRIKFSYGGVTIESGAVFRLEQHHLENNLTNKKHFDECLKYALEQVKLGVGLL